MGRKEPYGCRSTLNFLNGEENIINVQELETVGWNEMFIKQMETFSIKQLYKTLRGEYQKVEWRRLIFISVACPK